MSRQELGAITPEIIGLREKYKAALQATFASRLGGKRNFQRISSASEFLKLEAEAVEDDSWIKAPPHLSGLIAQEFAGCPPINIVTVSLQEEGATIEVQEQRVMGYDEQTKSLPLDKLDPEFLPDLSQPDRSVWRKVQFNFERGEYIVHTGRSQGPSEWIMHGIAKKTIPFRGKRVPIPWQVMADFAELPALLNVRRHSQIVVHGR